MLSGKGLGATGAGLLHGHGRGPRGLVVVRFVEGLEEWVSHSFGGQVCAWAVAWDDLDRTGRVIQRQEILKDALHEEIIVAAGVVGAADGAGEERVAAEEDALGALEEAQAAA